MDKRRGWFNLYTNTPSYSFKSIHSNVSTAEDHDENYIKVRLPLVRHLLRDRLLLEDM